MKNLLKKLITLVTLCAMLSVSVIVPTNPGVCTPNSDEDSIIINNEKK